MMTLCPIACDACGRVILTTGREMHGARMFTSCEPRRIVVDCDLFSYVAPSPQLHETDLIPYQNFAHAPHRRDVPKIPLIHLRHPFICTERRGAWSDRAEDATCPVCVAERFWRTGE